ncbi:ATP synthase subunit O, mitochondrial [Irineochytrium annulatum]|nr:ATP synthase subunit O, mitochondrial [Irineochytrium annulatum]
MLLGGLVRKILDTKSKLEGKNDEGKHERQPKDKSAAKREIEALRESIQVLCRNTNPLSKTMDYMQEDVDSMNKELELWRSENKKYRAALDFESKETAEAIAPLDAKLKSIDTSIEDLLEKISNSKAAIIQKTEKHIWLTSNDDPFQIVSRGFATASTSGPVQVPVVLHGIEGRYATALYTAATKKNALDAVENDLKGLRSIIDRDPKIQSFLETPIMDRTAKKQGVDRMLSQGKYSEITQNFFSLLAENGRLDQTGKIMGAFHQILMAHRGEVPVVVTSAKELDAKLSRQLKDTLQRSSLVSGNQKLQLTSKIDPSILGGLIIEVGDKTIDLSVSSKVAKLDRLLKEQV